MEDTAGLFFGCGVVVGKVCGGLAAGDMIATSVTTCTADSLWFTVIDG